MYKTQALQADTTFFDLQKEILLEWHTQDPVDDQELKRTHLIATYQSGKPNPFIIDPTLAYRLYGDPISSD